MKNTYEDSASEQHPDSESRAAESVEITEPPLDPDSPAAERLIAFIGRMIALRHGQKGNGRLKDDASSPRSPARTSASAAVGDACQ